MFIRHPALICAWVLTLCPWLVTDAAGAQCTFSDSSVAARPAVMYRFALRTSADTVVLSVTLEFTGARSGVDTIAVPDSWAGEKLSAVSNLRAVDGGAEIIDQGSGRRVVQHAPNAPLRIGYDLVNDWTGPFNHPYEFHPIVLPDHLEFTGNNALVRPALDPHGVAIVHFDWSSLPGAWSLATSFGSAERVDAKSGDSGPGGRCQTYLGPWRSVADAVYAAGDFRLHHFAVHGQPVVLAIRGAWTFSDSAAMREAQQTIGLDRDFWHDDNFQYFAVIWAPFDTDRGSSDGTAFTNALWIFMSRLDSLSTQITQLTHETFHEWDPRRMGVEPSDEERRIRWFHEGFTAYYADVIAYRGGLLSLSDLLSHTNADIRQFSHSSSAYVRGRVIALWLDGAIRKRSDGKRSLDDVMYDMVRGADKPLTLERILETIDRYLSPTDEALLGRAVAGDIDVRAITPSAGQLAPCVQITLDSAYAFDLGFDLASSQASHSVTGVRPGGPAAAAGLRDGEPLLTWSVDNGRSDRPAVFTIQAGRGQHRVSFYPRGAASLVPQLNVASGYRPQPGACGLATR